MAKFKVGDKVRVRKWDDMAKEYGVIGGNIQIPCQFTQGMKEYCGRVVTIKEVRNIGPAYRTHYSIEEDKKGNGAWGLWKFSEEMFEPEVVKNIKPESASIVIYKKDNKVIALDKTTGKTAEAICSEEDEFNFYTGADLAFERLRGRTAAPKTKKDTPKYYSGDIVCIESMSRSFVKGKIYKIRDGKMVNVDYDDWLDKKRFSSLDEINKVFASQFIEVVR